MKVTATMAMVQEVTISVVVMVLPKTLSIPVLGKPVQGTPNVTWERAKKSNAGIDLNMFKDRLTINADVFQEKRDNILWNRGTVPGIVGSDLPASNIGKVTNKGYEIQVHWGDKIAISLMASGGMYPMPKTKQTTAMSLTILTLG